MKDLGRYNETESEIKWRAVDYLASIQNLVKQPLTKNLTHRSDLFFFLIDKEVSFHWIFPATKLTGTNLTERRVRIFIATRVFLYAT